MMGGWRGRLVGLAILAPLLVLPVVAMAGSRAGPTLVVRGPDGTTIASLELPDGRFTLRYRNSLYRSLADENYAVTSDGRIRLISLAADELAVLEEYYAIDDPAHGVETGPRAWQATPARPVVIERLTVAATDLGQRTLLVDGEAPLELWRLVDDGEPSVHLDVLRR
jgi:hypothetical protein